MKIRFFVKYDGIFMPWGYWYYFSKWYNISIKTLEKWITSYNKNPHCFDHVTEIVYDFNPVNNDNDINYDDLNKDELKNIIMKKDIEIAR